MLQCVLPKNIGLTCVTTVTSIDYSVHSSFVTLPSNVLLAFFPLHCWAQSGVLMLLYHPEIWNISRALFCFSSR